ncbi:probable aminopeptidase NPEPL1 isoform X3 [Erpetoichthys calabaricus]|uniref:Aminopeptidase like 1 n=1 Tax=Erpetoichthys calabaricus TaxID=27687 RepID=A0A8C4S7F9_ERPCA|nr:probable aminopeptidase NPEPL1 isoform X1 [Erpetoichthys calabaricus]XP_051789046.1 probable aminopeptidase NPEPL1 isoform X2 [Erpetoichthys calabaricus]XP_051789047.1 probable aminopeptidase NPEPL1 isoform X3 [Erpetoichthys calabaricus]
MSRERHQRDCDVAVPSPREAVSGKAAVVIGLNMANVTLEFRESTGDSDPLTRPVLILGQLSNLQRVSWSQLQGKLQPSVNQETWQSALATLNPNPTDSCPLYLNYAVVAALPSRVSRHNSPAATHFLTRLLRNCMPVGANRCIVMICERSEVFASACAIARAFPLFTRRSSASRRADKRVVVVEFIVVGQDNGPLEVSALECLSNAAEGVRLAARIVDTPCNEMNTDHFLQEIKVVGSELGIVPAIIRGEELKERGFGGIYGVGKAAEHPPALAVLSHLPEGATQTIAWVGKGIVYDTGGLSIKGKTTMPGMKRDCGGAAAVLGAFKAAVKRGFKDNLHAVFCLAENAVGPNATRPDDIHILYSGKSVEINNTDAEGRLVLSDGVAYASKDLGADIILDMATLTGAQGISTGKYHAAVVTNSETWETACAKAGRSSGDLIHPLVYCPELHFSEFTSAVADMKNSVADRENAQSSCAALFIASHIGFDWPGVWVHVDIASPVHAGERATGYGVALLLALFGRASEDPLLNLVSPLGLETSMECDEVERDSKRRRLV